MPFSDVLHHSVELGNLTLVDEVSIVDTHRWAIRWNRYNLQTVCIHQLGGLCLRRAGHTRQFVVHAEVVLQSDGGESLILLTNLHALFGLHCLVQTFAPTPSLKDAASEFIHNLYIATLDDVVLVTLVELLGFQCRL